MTNPRLKGRGFFAFLSLCVALLRSNRTVCVARDFLVALGEEFVEEGCNYQAPFMLG